MNQKQTTWRTFISRLLKAALLIAMMLMTSRARAQAPITTVQSISQLQAINTTGMTNDTVVYVVDYYGAGLNAARGGGHFHWVSNNCCFAYPGVPAAPDGGRFIACNTGNTNGIWERLLNGGTANVKMWGAYGDGMHDDTIAISNALYSVANWGNFSEYSVGGLLFPAGTYLVSNTLVFATHIYGEGALNTTVMMAYGVNKDIFHSVSADNWINTGSGTWDQGLVVENMKICFQTSGTNFPPLRNTSNAALVIGLPGELSSISHVHTEYGGVGICAMGGGAPGVKIRNCKTDDCLIGVAIVPLPGYANGVGGPTVIDELSGDQILPDIGATASLIVISNVFGGKSISHVKAESDWGGGLIHYYSCSASANLDDCTIVDCGWNNGTINGQTNPPGDFLVIDASSGFTHQGPIFTLQGIGSYGAGNLIRDNIGNRLVDSDTQTETGNYQVANPQAITYQANFGGAGYPTNWTTGSGLFMGQTAITTFAPTNAGWYRIMAGGNLSGRVSIVNPYGLENIELEVDCSEYHTPWINVNRCKKGPQVVTQARAITYSDTFIGGEWSFVDIYVANPISLPGWAVPYRENRLIVSLDTAGNTPINVLQSQLLSPIIPVSATPPSGSSSVTNNTYR